MSLKNNKGQRDFTFDRPSGMPRVYAPGRQLLVIHTPTGEPYAATVTRATRKGNAVLLSFVVQEKPWEGEVQPSEEWEVVQSPEQGTEAAEVARKWP